MAEAAAIIAQTVALTTLLTAQTAATIAQVPAYFAAKVIDDTARDLLLDGFSVIEIGLMTTQLGIYWAAAKNATDDRDDIIDKQIIFMDELESKKLLVDLPMIQDKKDVLTNLFLPVINVCDSVTVISTESKSDGEAVQLKAEQLMNETCEGLPAGWGLHDGLLMGAKAGDYSGGIAANAEIRRVEAFESSRLSLIRAAHSGLKSIYNAGDTLGQYAQAAAVHSGIADLWTSGVNSAGAALGVALGQLSTGTSNDKNVTFTNPNPGVSLNAGTSGGENVG